MPRREERPFKRGAVNQNRWCSSMAEQLICNQQVGGSTPFTSSIFMGEFPSGQRGQTVNLLSLTSVVRIHLPPPDGVDTLDVHSIFSVFMRVCGLFFVSKKMKYDLIAFGI